MRGSFTDRTRGRRHALETRPDVESVGSAIPRTVCRLQGRGRGLQHQLVLCLLHHHVLHSQHHHTPTRASGVRSAVSGVVAGVSRLLVSDPSFDAATSSLASLLLLWVTPPARPHMIALISASLTVGAGRFSFARLRAAPVWPSRRLSCIMASGRLLSVMRLKR